MALCWGIGLLAGPALADPGAAVDSTAASRPAALDEAWSSPEVAAPQMEEEVLHRSPVVARPDASKSAGRSGFGWVRTTASLAGVVALIVLLTWGYRLVAGAGGSLGGRARHTGLIETLCRSSLTPRQTLYLVRVGPQLILVGATNEQLRALSVIDDPDLAARLSGHKAEQRQDSHSSAFRRWLSSESGNYAEGQEQAPAAPAQAERIGSLRQRLQETVSRLRGTAAKD
jgi:flagellar biogenesis protein FliO